MLLLTACTQVGELTKADAQVIAINDSQGIDSEIESLITLYRDSLELIMDKELCQSLTDFPKVKGQTETRLGNLVADLCLEKGRQLTESKIDACMMNIGGLRSSLPTGSITLGNVYELMPFDNELVLVTLPANEVDSMFKYLAIKGGDPVSGITMGIKDAQAVHPMIGDQAVETGKTYTILTSDYLSNGGDNMTFFTEGHRVEIEFLGLKVRDAIAAHFTEKGNKGEAISGYLDNRIHHEE
jgi:2',3'-cyclic-nucleotide 2'-phosphodiesterase (5'-nucleotidase family)